MLLFTILATCHINGKYVCPQGQYTYDNMEVIVMNKRAILSAIAALFAMAMSAQALTVDTYTFTMRLNVPRIYDNMQSKGYRKYQPQSLKGNLHFIYTDEGETLVKVTGLTNKTHKVGGKPVTYTCYEWPYEDNEVLVVGIGNNKTLKFTQGGASFSFVAEPSYNIGKVDEDNTLMLELSGHGTLKGDILKNLRGVVRGNIGCGCKAYGHVSPTRRFFGFLTSVVWDVAPLDGTFRAVFKRRQIGPIDIDKL